MREPPSILVTRPAAHLLPDSRGTSTPFGSRRPGRASGRWCRNEDRVDRRADRRSAPTDRFRATANETESRILRGLRKQVPDLPDDSGLIESFVALRRGSGRKVSTETGRLGDGENTYRRSANYSATPFLFFFVFNECQYIDPAVPADPLN